MANIDWHVGIQKGDRGSGPTLKNYKIIGFPSNTGPDPLKNHKATKPAFNVGPSSARQRNAILMAFRWQADDGPFIAVFGSYMPSSTKKKKCYQIWTPVIQNFLDLRMTGYSLKHCQDFS